MTPSAFRQSRPDPSSPASHPAFRRAYALAALPEQQEIRIGAGDFADRVKQIERGHRIAALVLPIALRRDAEQPGERLGAVVPGDEARRRDAPAHRDHHGLSFLGIDLGLPEPGEPSAAKER